MRSVRWRVLLVGAVLAAVGAAGFGQAVHRARTRHPRTGAALLVPGPDGKGQMLNTGWRISPVGRLVPMGDLVMGGAISPDGKTLAIANAGYNPHALHLIDLATEKEIATFPVLRTFNGVAWSPDGKRIYLGGAVTNPLNDVYVFERGADGAWTQGKGFSLDPKVAPKRTAAGLAASPDGKWLYVCDTSDDALFVLDTATGATAAHIAAGNRPIVCRLAADGKTLFVADWGGSQLSVLDVVDPAAPSVIGKINTGDHPNDIALASDGRGYVSCANSDAMTVFDAAARHVIETVRIAITPKAPSGTTPNAVAVAPDGRTVYVADADSNSVAVVDVSRRGDAQVRGFIPTQWYSTAVLVSRDGKRVIIGSGKGTGTHPNPAPIPIDQNAPKGFEYIAKQLNGAVDFVDTPDGRTIARYTRMVRANTPYRDSDLTRANAPGGTAIPVRVGDPSPIKYVLYIIKENRTYDQMYGDLPQGNGDPDLCLFGRQVTPNHHALAQEFVLLDNLYCAGEVSQDGHPWSTQALVSDYTERAWPNGYSRKPTITPEEELTHTKTGFIWEACARAGISYRSYGEYATDSTLVGHHSEAYIGKVKYGDYSPARDTGRADIFVAEFKQFERTHTIPRFMVMSLGENHTHGTAPGQNTPKACVASNDVAVGKIVDAISHSSVWDQYAIFIIEDDAQNGADHVDAHRTDGLVISPYTRRHAVDSTFYTTNSMLRTIELILGLGPLSQYDAAAAPMTRCFTSNPDLTPFTALPAQIDLNAKNTKQSYGAAASARMDFSQYDRIDEGKLNRILWHSIKGANVPYPTVKHRADAASPPGPLP